MKSPLTLFIKLHNGDVIRKSFDCVFDCISKASKIAQRGRIGILRRKVDTVWATYDHNKAIAIAPITLC